MLRKFQRRGCNHPLEGTGRFQKTDFLLANSGHIVMGIFKKKIEEKGKLTQSVHPHPTPQNKKSTAWEIKCRMYLSVPTR